jgi:hypothetical protein
MSSQTGSDPRSQAGVAVRPLTGPHHGNTLAAWVMVGIMSVGAVIAAVGVSMWNLPVSIVGAVIVAVGLIAGKVLSLAGYGAHRAPGAGDPGRH